MVCECSRVWERALCRELDAWTFFTTSLDPLDEVTVNKPVEHLWESEYHVWVLPAPLDVTDQSNLYHGLSGLRSGAPLPLHQGGATNQPTNPLWAPLPPVILHLDLLLDIDLCSSCLFSTQEAILCFLNQRHRSDDVISYQQQKQFLFKVALHPVH